MQSIRTGYTKTAGSAHKPRRLLRNSAGKIVNTLKNSCNVIILMPHAPDKHDLAVITALRQNCRSKHTVLARKFSWPVSTTHERIRRCMNQYIHRAVALLDFKSLGLTAHAFWIVRPHVPMREAWIARVAKTPQVNQLSRMHSGDFLVETIAQSRAEEEDLNAILSTNAVLVGVYPVLEELCRESFLSKPEGLPEFGPTGE